MFWKENRLLDLSKYDKFKIKEYQNLILLALIILCMDFDFSKLQEIEERFMNNHVFFFSTDFN